MTRIAVLHGSSRHNGNTETLAKLAVQGLNATEIFLADYLIRPIDDKRHDPAGFGHVDDDYANLITTVVTHDVLVFATPIYWYGMSGQMKNFVDRWSQSLRDQTMNFKAQMNGKQAYLIVVGGDDPHLKALPLVQQFQFICDFMNMSFGGYIIGEGNQPGDIQNDARAIFQAKHLNEQLRA